MIEQGFYAAEAASLRTHPDVKKVRCSNRLKDVLFGDYDALVSYFYSHSAATTLIARLRRKRSVVTGGGEQLFRGTSGITNYVLRLLAFEATALFASRILPTSTSDYKRMLAIAPFARRKIQLSFHGAPAADRFCKANFDRPRPPASLVTICGMDTELNVRRKGLFEALQLLRRLTSADSDASLTIIGRTTCRAMVEQRARELEVAERVRYSGYVTEEEKLRLLRESRFYVQLSEYEGFGIGALEALTQGCHVIHSGVGGLLDTVAEFGTLVERDAVTRVEPRKIPEYQPDLEQLGNHLQQFTERRRADDIVSAVRGS